MQVHLSHHTWVEYGVLRMSCPICGAKVKNWETKRHQNSKRHQAALLKAGGKPAAVASRQRSQTLSPVASPVNVRVSALERAVAEMSSKLEFVLDEMAQVQRKLAGSGPMSRTTARQPSGPQSSAILHALDVTRRDSTSNSPWVSVEAVFSNLLGGSFTWGEFEQQAARLFDNGAIELGEGGRNRKIRMRGKLYGLVRKH